MFTGLDVPPVRLTAGIPMASPGGVALTVDVYRPDNDLVVPVVVQIYGGGWRNGTPGNDATLARALAASGFAVFAIDYRHTPDWRWPAQLEDVLDGIRWVATHAAEYQADATRMGVIGRSAGAQLAMRASQDDNLTGVDAVVTLYGPVDLVEGHRSPPAPDPLDVRRVEEALFGATPESRLDAYVDASPITRADRPHPPILVVTAGRDHIVEPHFGALLHERLAKTGVSVLLHLPWADHAFDAVPFGPSSQIALHYTQRFFDLTLR
jgi:acetyl esterase/lipase